MSDTLPQEFHNRIRNTSTETVSTNYENLDISSLRFNDPSVIPYDELDPSLVDTEVQRLIKERKKMGGDPLKFSSIGGALVRANMLSESVLQEGFMNNYGVNNFTGALSASQPMQTLLTAQNIKNIRGTGDLSFLLGCAPGPLAGLPAGFPVGLPAGLPEGLPAGLPASLPILKLPGLGTDSYTTFYRYQHQYQQQLLEQQQQQRHLQQQIHSRAELNQQLQMESVNQSLLSQVQLYAQKIAEAQAFVAAAQAEAAAAQAEVAEADAEAVALTAESDGVVDLPEAKRTKLSTTEPEVLEVPRSDTEQSPFTPEKESLQNIVTENGL